MVQQNQNKTSECKDMKVYFELGNYSKAKKEAMECLTQNISKKEKAFAKSIIFAATIDLKIYIIGLSVIGFSILTSVLVLK